MLFLGGGKYLPLSGGVLTGNVVFWNGGADDVDSSPETPSLYFQRGTTSGQWTDWKINGSGGNLFFDDNDLSGNWMHRVWFGEEGDVNAKVYKQSSDMRLKNILKDIKLDVNDISNAPIFKFTWKGNSDKRPYVGTSAQYWKNVTPELVSEAPDEMHTLSMQYDVIALASVISVAKKVIELEQHINKLEG